MIFKYAHVKFVIQIGYFTKNTLWPSKLQNTLWPSKLHKRFSQLSSLIIPHNSLLKYTQYQRYTNTYSIMESDKCLRELGYAFNESGQLRRLDQNGQITDEPFQFKISDVHQQCQSHYEKIGDVITDYVYHLLENQEKLIRLPVPADSISDTGTFIFVSEDYDKKDTLMVLIHGSGVVRAGQWARSLIINDKLDNGTQIPYIKKGIERDFGIMILNTNENCLPNGKKISKSGTAEDHACYVWEKYVSKTKASSIVIVAHSYGGVVTITLSQQLKKDFDKRVKAVAFTDSVHSFSNIKLSDHLKKIARNWISSSSPLDTPMKTPDYDVDRVSAGHPQHEMTSSACIDSVFKFIDKQISQK